MRERFAAFRRDMVWPLWNILREDGRPTRDMNVNILGILVVPQQCLRVLPAVESCDLAKLGVDDILQRFALAIAINGTLNVSWLDLTAVIDNCASLIYVGPLGVSY